jgi:hypothetical protein
VQRVGPERLVAEGIEAERLLALRDRGRILREVGRRGGAAARGEGGERGGSRGDARDADEATQGSVSRLDGAA